MSRPEYGMDPQSRRECGTATGYNRHYRAGERACRPCLDAHAAAKRARRAARAATAGPASYGSGAAGHSAAPR